MSVDKSNMTEAPLSKADYSVRDFGRNILHIVGRSRHSHHRAPIKNL
jgi:hypothetical protein